MLSGYYILENLLMKKNNSTLSVSYKHLILYVIFVLIFIQFSNLPSYSQSAVEQDAVVSGNVVNDDTGVNDNLKNIKNILSSSNPNIPDDIQRQNNNYNFIVSMTKIVLGFLLVGFLFYSSRRIISLILGSINREHAHTPRDVISVSGLVLIVFAIIAVVLLVETPQIISTAIGVLGTIAGYLFGTVQERLSATRPPNHVPGDNNNDS